YIDFTAPEAVLDNVEAAAGHGLDCIIGTTGWYEAEDQARELAAAQDVRILYSPNFSTGIYALFGALEYLAAVLGDQGFDASIVEKHHTGKTDAPSGTAHEMAQILLEGMQHKDEVVEAREGAHQSGELDIASVRVGDEPGEHEVTFTAPGHSEKLVLRHQSSGQAVFAEGVLRAVDWLATTDIGPGLYTFREDVLE
ncbi:MAG: 4-hydroxy-tetrahydrodipicolinate reductase, partial [Candidatus Nanohaloarchaea archaeon]|nr:4-hydroxy-tetrahydrodipicolinate reductase [Candidatus Nanohaloarchaea archaeon]